MSKYNPRIHKRRSIRLKGYDYAQEGLYFITLCCQDRKHLFGKIENGIMLLNEAGRIVEEEWEKTPDIRDNIALHEYIIMPNHFHCIIEILFSKKEEKGENKESQDLDSINPGEFPDTGELQFAPSGFSPDFKSPSHTIGAIIRGFKGASTKRIKELYFPKNEGNRGELQFAPIALSDKIWQRNYYENIIRNQRAYFNISNYIRNNPLKWEEDKFRKP